MAFSKNPFDHVGTLDTTGLGLAPTTAGLPAGVSIDSTTVGTGVNQANTSVTSICPAFTDSTLPADAANRTIPAQPIYPSASWH